ncbi:nicotinate phosphoribosyltransferase [Thermovibrio sp.]
MRTSDFLKEEGLKHFTDKKPEGFRELPQVKAGVHRLQFFTDGKRWLFNASRRCKKLLALSEVACRLLEEGKEVKKGELLTLFRDEKDRKKMEERAEIVLRALEK